MKKEMTKRAENLLSAIKKIEDWCNSNLSDESIKVFVMHRRRDPYVWHNFTYSVCLRKLYFLRGDHGTCGANDWSFDGVVTQERFERETTGQGNNNCVTAYDRLDSDGNLIFDKEVSSFVRCWSSEKADIIRLLKETEDLENFKA